MSAPLRVALPDRKMLDALEPIAGVDFVLWDLTGPPPSGRFDLLVPPYMGKPAALGALDALRWGWCRASRSGTTA